MEEGGKAERKGKGKERAGERRIGWARRAGRGGRLIRRCLGGPGRQRSADMVSGITHLVCAEYFDGTFDTAHLPSPDSLVRISRRDEEGVPVPS